MIYVYNASYERSSYGVRILYTLVEILNSLGYMRAKTICHEQYTEQLEEKIPLRYKNSTLYEKHNFDKSQIKDDDIVVYSDVISGNPLEAKRVVRYLLNRPYYLLSQGVEYGDSDFLMAYSQIVDENLPQLFILNDDRHLYGGTPSAEKQDQLAIYFGKVNLGMLSARSKEIQRIVSSYKKTIIITRFYPTSKLELIKILRTSQLLLCFDPLTNLSYEATLCGTPSVVFDNTFSSSRKNFNLPLYGVMNDLRQWEEASREVSLAFGVYEEALEYQNSKVFQMFEKIEKHFRTIEKRTTEGYLERTRVLNKVQAELDLARAQGRMNSRQLVNVYLLKQIPTKLRKLVLQKASGSELKQLRDEEITIAPPVFWLRSLIDSLVKAKATLKRHVKLFVRKLMHHENNVSIEDRSSKTDKFELTVESFNSLASLTEVDKLRIQVAVRQGYPDELIAGVFNIGVAKVRELRMRAYKSLPTA